MDGFSSTDKTSAFSGGFRYSPTTSAALGPNAGSVLMHQLLRRCRQILRRRSMRQTCALLTSPNRSASSLPFHCEYPLGGASSSSFSTRLSVDSSYLAGLPERAASCSPDSRSAANL